MMNSRLSFLKFPTTYNNHGATPNIRRPDKLLHCKAFRASFTLGAAGNIGAGNAAKRCDLPLGEGRAVVQAVAQADDVGLPSAEAGFYAPAHLGAGVPQIQILQHIVIHPDYVDQGQRAVLSVAVQRVREG